ncbi:hypothetical protein C1H46_011164 [Malus baccata]|uniref:Uncharacterized protein n=1 Tax=Malus baccata TaxID=106549 RepID=A0A540MYB6_MALBA|nr:hypothetical protein C1H46_011164 [Malus baccata]
MIGAMPTWHIKLLLPAYKKPCHTRHPKTFLFTVSMLNMRRQITTHLLLVWLLLAASQYHHRTTYVQAIESVQFKLNTAQPASGSGSLGSRTRYVLPTKVGGRNIHKTPSGPNPVGNHRPPSKQ